MTTAARREVYERDGLQCTYVAEDGRRCEARAFLELDHTEPKAFGGSGDATNLRIRCRGHNRLWAEQAFGRERIRQRVEQSRDLRRKKSTLRCGDEKHGEREAQAEVILEKVLRALRGIGFRDSEARRASAEIVRMHDANEPLPVERALREALLVATAA